MTAVEALFGEGPLRAGIDRDLLGRRSSTKQSVDIVGIFHERPSIKRAILPAQVFLVWSTSLGRVCVRHVFVMSCEWSSRRLAAFA